ncbi:MAG: RNA polymerase sigma factor [Hyphomicrobiales bacterium]|nr:MAG: RNA polymerase sigma factor [Hyphomicrobiales bacterium]
MTETGWALLQRHLLVRYGHFKKRLTRYLGSSDLASEALHETWLRLARGGELATVRNPDTYLYSMAINIASNHRRAANRRLTSAEVDALLEVADDAPDAAHSLGTREELEAVVAIIKELPMRQQAILLAARLEGVPRREIAARFGISERLVQRELQKAHEACALRLEELKNGQTDAPPRDADAETVAPKPAGRRRREPGVGEP